MPEIRETLADRYELLDLIGQGGQALVFRARDTRAERDVAVKMLSKSASNDPRWVERMAREQQAMVALAGTGAVGFIDVCTSKGGALCLVMELLDGSDLEAHLKEHEKEGNRLAVEEVVRLIAPIVDTLEKAHSVGIVHRDLKPSNIFVARTGDGTRARLLDFGFARTKASKQITATGMILGSPSYIAPEMWLPRPKAPDQRVDVYALGVILFRMLSGQLPFKGETLKEKFIAITTSERPSLHALRRELPKNVDIWVERALAIEAKDRFPSVRGSFGELVWALGLAPHPTEQKASAPPSTDLRRIREWLEAPLNAIPNTLSAAFNWAAGALGRLKRLATSVPGAAPQERADEVLALPPRAPATDGRSDVDSTVFAVDESGMRPAIELGMPRLIGANDTDEHAGDVGSFSLGRQSTVAIEEETELIPHSHDRATIEQRTRLRATEEAAPRIEPLVNPVATTVFDTGPPPKVTTRAAYDVTLDDREGSERKAQADRGTLPAAKPKRKSPERKRFRKKAGKVSETKAGRLGEPKTGRGSAKASRTTKARKQRSKKKQRAAVEARSTPSKAKGPGKKSAAKSASGRKTTSPRKRTPQKAANPANAAEKAKKAPPK